MVPSTLPPLPFFTHLLCSSLPSLVLSIVLSTLPPLPGFVHGGVMVPSTLPPLPFFAHLLCSSLPSLVLSMVEWWCLPLSLHSLFLPIYYAPPSPPWFCPWWSDGAFHSPSPPFFYPFIMLLPPLPGFVHGGVMVPSTLPPLPFFTHLLCSSLPSLVLSMVPSTLPSPPCFFPPCRQSCSSLSSLVLSVVLPTLSPCLCAKY